jgi:hypothetical protein
MDRTTSPDTHAIDATKQQIDWLNRIADVSQKYRTNVTWLKHWSVKALESEPAMTDIDHQTFSKVQQLNGELGSLLALRAIIFPPIVSEDPEERTEFGACVSEWIKLARTGNPNGMLGMNWFVAVKKED